MAVRAAWVDSQKHAAGEELPAGGATSFDD